MKKIIVVSLFLMVQGCGDQENRIQDYLESGKSLYKQGNYAKAKVEFKNVIQLDNKQADAFYHLALIDEKDQNWQGMFANLSQVIKLNPKNTDARLKLGRLFLLSGEFDKTLQQVEAILKFSVDNADALALKGAVLLKQGDSEGAMALADKALKLVPEHIDAVSLKSVTYLSKKNYKAALDTIEKVLQVKPDDMSLNLLKLQIHTQSKNLAAAEQDYLDFIKRFPDKLEFKYALAKNYSDNGQDDKALKTLQGIISENADKLQPKLVLVDYLVKKNPKQAEKTLKDYIAQFPEETEFYFRLADIYILQNKYADAKQPLNWIVDNKKGEKEGLSAKVKLATFTAQEGNLKMASAMIKEVLAVDTRNFEALLLKSRIDFINGLYDEAISNLRSILRDYPESDEAMVLLAQAYIKKDSPELAEENFRKALDLNPGNFEAVMSVVSSMIKSKDILRADEILQKALALKPDHAGALQALAQVRLLRKDWLGTQKVADLISAQPKGEGFSKYLGGKISQGQGLFEEAVVKYKDALAISPRLSDALRGLMSCYEALNQRNNMFAYLEEFIKANPNDYYPLILKSQILMLDKHLDDALNVLAGAIDNWPNVPELYEAMANVYSVKNETDKAISIYKKGLQNIPDNVGLRMMLASAYEQVNDYDKALENYEVIISKQPDVDIAVNNLVSLLLDHSGTKENIERAVKLASRFEKSNQPYFLDTYGWALINSGRNVEALEVFKNVVAKMPEVAVFKYHLGVAYYQSNDKTAAIAELEQALAIGKKDGNFVEKEKVEKLLKEIKAVSPA